MYLSLSICCAEAEEPFADQRKTGLNFTFWQRHPQLRWFRFIFEYYLYLNIYLYFDLALLIKERLDLIPPSGNATPNSAALYFYLNLICIYNHIMILILILWSELCCVLLCTEANQSTVLMCCCLVVLCLVVVGVAVLLCCALLSYVLLCCVLFSLVENQRTILQSMRQGQLTRAWWLLPVNELDHTPTIF